VIIGGAALLLLFSEGSSVLVLVLGSLAVVSGCLLRVEAAILQITAPKQRPLPRVPSRPVLDAEPPPVGGSDSDRPWRHRLASRPPAEGETP
jgi:hypothetical protein